MSEGRKANGVILTKAEFRRRIMDEQRRRKAEKDKLAAKRRADWYAYQSDKSVRIRNGAWKGAGRGASR